MFKVAYRWGWAGIQYTVSVSVFTPKRGKSAKFCRAKRSATNWFGIALLSHFPRSRHQGLKQPPLTAHEEQKLRVPLHSDHEASPRRFDGLSDMVQVACADHQSFTHLVDGLIVQAVDLATVNTQQSRQVTVGLQA